MIDIKLIRENPQKVKEAVKAKQREVNIDKILALDKERRKILKEKESLEARQNKIVKEISHLKRRGEESKISPLRKEAKELAYKIKEKTKLLKEIERILNEELFKIPNIPKEDVPYGRDESDNKVIKEWGEKPKFDFKPKDYLEIAQNLDIIDVKKAAYASGTRFGYIKRKLVLLQWALIYYIFQKLVKEANFIPIIPPVMLKPEIFRGLGYIDWGDEEAYFIEKDKLYLVGTAEQSLIPLHANEILKEEDLPLRYLGYSTCFRREAGSYGKDTRGILRVHQFDKIEMVSFSLPEKSDEEHEFLLNQAQGILQDLKIPYRVVKMCTGDLAQPSARSYDLESFMPGQGTFRETHSISTCTDFQARRLNIRFRDKQGKVRFVHTLNGTALAMGRAFIAIIENYQTKEGKIKVPQVLQPICGFEIIG